MIENVTSTANAMKLRLEIWAMYGGNTVPKHTIYRLSSTYSVSQEMADFMNPPIDPIGASNSDCDDRSDDRSDGRTLPDVKTSGTDTERRSANAETEVGGADLQMGSADLQTGSADVEGRGTDAEMCGDVRMSKATGTATTAVMAALSPM